jgi:hypothetical protein
LAHSGKTKLDSRKAAKKSAEVRRRRAAERRETLRARLVRKLEEHADEVAAVYLRGVRSENETVALRAAEAWLSRVYGRPVETVKQETSSADLGELDPARIAAMPREERLALMRHLVERYPEVARKTLGPEYMAKLGISATAARPANSPARHQSDTQRLSPVSPRLVRDPRPETASLGSHVVLEGRPPPWVPP